MKIFLGSSSSTESLSDLRKIAMLIEEEGHEPLPWNKAGLFPLGNYMIDSLCKISLRVDAAILILNADDKVWYRNDFILKPRDNVVLEYGLFLQSLGREKTIICQRGNPTLASDLKGIIYCNLDKEYRAQSELVDWLRFIDTGT